MEVFQLIDVSDEQVVLKVNAENNLIVATHPYISGDYDYITVTRGREHIFTIIYKDGHTFDFHWGTSGYTMISDGLERLTREVWAFLKRKYVLLELKSNKITNAECYYNNSYHKWQLTFNSGGYWWSDTAECVEDIMEEAKHWIDPKGWVHSIAVTGIDVWTAVLE